MKHNALRRLGWKTFAAERSGTLLRRRPEEHALLDDRLDELQVEIDRLHRELVNAEARLRESVVKDDERLRHHPQGDLARFDSEYWIG